MLANDRCDQENLIEQLMEPGIESGVRVGGESGATWFLKIAPGGAASNNF
jgi:hypothetical protein